MTDEGEVLTCGEHNGQRQCVLNRLNRTSRFRFNEFEYLFQV